MKTAQLLVLLVAGSALALTGCTTVNSVENAQKMGQRNMITDSRVISDGSLSRKVSIVGVNTSMTPGGLLKVQVEVFNRTRSHQAFLYQFEWFDLNGMQVNNILSARIPEQIEGQESKFINGLAPTAACHDFRVKFIEAD